MALKKTKSLRQRPQLHHLTKASHLEMTCQEKAHKYLSMGLLEVFLKTLWRDQDQQSIQKEAQRRLPKVAVTSFLKFNRKPMMKLWLWVWTPQPQKRKSKFPNNWNLSIGSKQKRIFQVSQIMPLRFSPSLRETTQTKLGSKPCEKWTERWTTTLNLMQMIWWVKWTTRSKAKKRLQSKKRREIVKSKDWRK